jgi:uncharacterized protein YdcH (DUF465 family)
MVNYVSPRLRKDARSQIEDIVDDLDSLVDRLRDARRNDAMLLQEELAASKREKLKLQKELEVANRKALEQSRLLERFQQSLVAPPPA